MHANTLGGFKKISHQRKSISKVEKEICDYNNTLDFLKEEHGSLVSEQFIISYTLFEKISKDRM